MFKHKCSYNSGCTSLKGYCHCCSSKHCKYSVIASFSHSSFCESLSALCKIKHKMCFFYSLQRHSWRKLEHKDCWGWWLTSKQGWGRGSDVLGNTRALKKGTLPLSSVGKQQLLLHSWPEQDQTCPHSPRTRAQISLHHTKRATSHVKVWRNE